jgi:Myosin-like coiled-coil protein
VAVRAARMESRKLALLNEKLQELCRHLQKDNRRQVEEQKSLVQDEAKQTEAAQKLQSTIQSITAR